MKTLFTLDWQFRKDPIGTDITDIFNSTTWENIDIPHDFLIYDITDTYSEGISTYKKTFHIDLDELGSDRLTLIFEGVCMDSKIYLNQKEIFEWKNGYSKFEVDLTPHLINGKNTIYVTNTIMIPNSRWYAGAGIYRNVWLNRKPNVCFATDGGYISTTKKTSMGNTEELWDLHLDFELSFFERKYLNELNCFSIQHIITSSDGEEILNITTKLDNKNTEKYADELSICDSLVNKQIFTIKNPLLWDTSDANLYNLKSILLLNKEPLDTQAMRFGFRTISFDCNDGFFLNGRKLMVNGTCEHHTLGALGAAMNKAYLIRQLKILKKMGINAIRSSHNMPSKELLDLCDEMGLLLYTESFDMWEKTKTDHDYGKFFKDWWKKDLTSWVKQDRSHPSVFVWGIGNEIQDTHEPHGIEITRNLHNAVKALDYYNNAYTGIGSNLMEWEGAQNCANEVDLAGYNYMDHLYDEHHRKYKDWCIYGSETSSTLQSRGIYHFPLKNRLLTYDDGQCSSLGNCSANWGAKNADHVIVSHRDREFVWGNFLWSGFDYIGEPTPYFTKNSFFGQVDTAGFPKDSYYQYMAEWTDYHTAPMVHLFPYWDFNEGQMIDVRACTNAPRLEIFFADEKSDKYTSLKTFDIDHANDTELTKSIQIPYRKGKIKAVAYDENSKVIATDTASSFGDAKKITLKADKTELIADGRDLVFVEINTLDENDIFVANSRSRINVEVINGRLLGLDNGDSTDYEQYKTTSRKLFSGRLLAIIAANKEPGEIVVNVTSPSLTPATITLFSKECETETKSSFIENCKPNKDEKLLSEIPVRKIELKLCDKLINEKGKSLLTNEKKEAIIEAKILPENATYTDLNWKAITEKGVESNCVDIKVVESSKDKVKALLTAKGDGDFKLICSCNNSNESVTEVMSELEFSVTGMGEANFSPYKLVNGIDNSGCTADAKLSFQGGVYITSTERTRFLFSNIDFGEYGSDEIHVPIFSFEDVLPIEIWLGDSEKNNAKMLYKGNYEAKSWYNHYQENIFKLSARIKGIQSISIVVYPTIKMSLQGFYFTKYEKAFEKIYATENNLITGDSFEIKEDYIANIGNNVTLEFENMNFNENCAKSISICGHSSIDMNTIHVRFYNENSTVINEIVEFEKTDDFEEKTFDITGFTGNGKINIIFMPGSKFDLKWFKFHK